MGGHMVRVPKCMVTLGLVIGTAVFSLAALWLHLGPKEQGIPLRFGAPR